MNEIALFIGYCVIASVGAMVFTFIISFAVFGAVEFMDDRRELNKHKEETK